MELWDIYDCYRHKQNRTHARGSKMKYGDYHLVVHVWIMNNDGMYLIQKRQSSKKFYSGMWCSAASGSAITNETSLDACFREAKEEIGLDVDVSKAIYLLTTKSESSFYDVWFVKQEANIDDLIIQYEEVEDIKWATEEEIKEMVGKGEFISFDYLDFFFQVTKSNLTIKQDSSNVYEKNDYYKIYFNYVLIGNIVVNESDIGRYKIIITILEDKNHLLLENEIKNRIKYMYPQAISFNTE